MEEEEEASPAASREASPATSAHSSRSGLPSVAGSVEGIRLGEEDAMEAIRQEIAAMPASDDDEDSSEEAEAARQAKRKYSAKLLKMQQKIEKELREEQDKADAAAAPKKKKKKPAAKGPKKTPKNRKPISEQKTACTLCPGIRDNQDELAEWVRGYEWLYNKGCKANKDTKKKLALYAEKAAEMGQELTGKFLFCLTRLVYIFNVCQKVCQIS